MKKKVKLEWYAFYHSFNEDKLERINILREDIKERIIKGMKKGEYVLGGRPISSLGDLKEVLKRELMYYYWSKSEYEVLVRGLFEEKEHKIDIWYQLEPNLDRIAEYVNNEMELELKWK